MNGYDYDAVLESKKYRGGGSKAAKRLRLRRRVDTGAFCFKDPLGNSALRLEEGRVVFDLLTGSCLTKLAHSSGSGEKGAQNKQ